MVAYTRDEIISVSDMARGFSNVLGNIIDHTKEKIAISKNNKLEAVIVSIDEYEKLKEAYDILEHIEIYDKIQKRKNSKTISLEESMKRYGISSDEL
ncbi:MAG: type II toxin-antitoxin system prevent-host-death family antitoxin [Campylobacterota bacterium]|nr:type II toxin-antitoxin system prevent-host-death family antitoxin [Campylobacterota bacterium]